MAAKVELPAYTDDTGRLKFQIDPATVQQIVRERFGAGRALMVEIKPAGSVRSSRANAYYWGVCVQLVVAELINCGNQFVTAQRVHGLFKQSLLPPEYITTKDGVILGETVGTTTTLTRAEFYEFVESVRQWAAQCLSLNIPDPPQVEDETVNL